MKSAKNSLLAGVAMTAALVTLQATAVTTEIFSGFTDTAGGTPYSGLVGTLITPGVTFATDTGFNWHPFSLAKFGADITGNLDVAAAGIYSFSLNSDDGSMLLIDGSLIIDNGGGHGPNLKSGDATLAAGNHTFEVQFFEDFSGSSGVDLSLPAGVSFSTPDGGSSLAMLGGVVGLIGALARKLRG